MNMANRTEEQEATSVMFGFLDEITPARRWVLVWPREHGAWGILLVSLFTGSAVGISSGSRMLPLLWLTIGVLSAFCLRTPMENSMPRSPFRPRTHAEWRWVSLAGGVYTVIGSVAGVMLWLDRALQLVWMPAAAAIGLFGLQVLLKRLDRSLRLPAEIAGAFGLALAAAAGYIVCAGHGGELAAGVWMANALFVANQILYVQFRMQETRGGAHASPQKLKQMFLASEVAMLLAIVGGTLRGILPVLTLAAFLPVLVRGSAWTLRGGPTPLRIHRLGKSELAQAIAFGLIFIAVSRVHWSL